MSISWEVHPAQKHLLLSVIRERVIRERVPITLSILMLVKLAFPCDDLYQEFIRCLTQIETLLGK